MFLIRICYWIGVLFGVQGRVKGNYPYLLVPSKYIVSELETGSGEYIISNSETGDTYSYIKPTKEISLSVHWYKDMTFLERCILKIFLYDEVLNNKLS